MTEAGHNSIAHDQLRAYVERVERLEQEIRGLNSDKADIYAEAKGLGFDVKALKRVIALRRMDAAARQELQHLVALYTSALGMTE